MATFDVTLPINKPVVFPPRCVVCEKSNPDGAIKLSILGANSSSTLDLAVESGVFEGVDSKIGAANTLNKIDGIPACKSCSFGLKWYHRLLKFGYYTGWIPGLILLVSGLPTWVSIPVIILGAIAPGVVSLIFPPSFGASFWDDKANFEFKSEKTATEFLQLNSDASLKSDKAKSAASLNEVERSE